MRKKNITIITGTRAEFGIWQPVVLAIKQSKKLNLQLIATGMHLQRQFGYTLDLVKFCFSHAIPVRMYQKNDTPADSLARATAALAKTYQELNSDLIMVLGDRLEMLAAANAALACQLPIAHVHGGETAPGQWDEQIRHAITKMAHLHFAATKNAAARIRRMGENPMAIHIVGAPAIDWAVHEAELNQRMGAAQRANPILLLHPTSPNEDLEYRRTRMLVKLLHRFFPNAEHNRRISAIGPNNDPGFRGILRAYEERKHIVALEMSRSQEFFWGILHNSAFLIGNSSAGIIEAATFGVPVINLGERQKGRERNPNVIDIPWSAGESGIKKAIHHALTHKQFLAEVAKRRNLYGDGLAAERIVKVLESLDFPIPITKQFYD